MRITSGRTVRSGSCLIGLATAAVIAFATPSRLLAINGEILQQQLSSGKGYTVLRVWGNHYDMGYAHGWLMHTEIAAVVSQLKVLVGTNYATARSLASSSVVWKPDAIEAELDGMTAALAVREPAAGIDKIDLKVANIVGSDLGYGTVACRSHSCWGHFVADPVKTISTRRLDFSTPITAANHHVLCVWLPTDGSPAWANLSWASAVSVVTAVNELGIQTSLHDYNSSSGTPYLPCLPRSVAARYALTMVTDPNLPGDPNTVYNELRNYDAGTGSFINYYAPQGYGAVITCRRSPRPTFYKLRVPQSSYFSGDVLITTNSETTGTTTPSGGEFMATYYQNLDTNHQTATLQGHWDLMGSTGLHKMSVAYRAKGDMTLWFHGRLDPGYTSRVELEWANLDSRRKLSLGVVNPTWGTVGREPNLSIYEPNQIVTLQATPIEGKAFRHWEIYNPNYPGDANYAVIDANTTLTLVMDSNKQVAAVFKCGGGAGQALPLLAMALAGLAVVVRFARTLAGSGRSSRWTETN